MPRILALLLVLACAASMAGDAAKLELRDGWVRSGPPAAKVLAAYGTLRNSGDKPLVVTGVRSADFDRASLHEMHMAGDVMKMRELERVEVAAHRSVELAPGASHLMLFEPKRALKAGDRVPLELTLADGSTISATLDVR